MTRDQTIRRLPAVLLLICVVFAWSVWFGSSGGGRIDRTPVATPTACFARAEAVPCS
jgi:hypothetical protein